MQFHIQSTVFGQFVRLTSRNKVFRYPDEIDPSLWEKAVRQDTQSPQPEQALRPVYDRTEEEKQKSTGVADGASDILVVGWYGPADPEVSLWLF